MSRYQGHDARRGIDRDLTFLRFTFCGKLGRFHPDRQLDTPIERTLWLTPDEIRASVQRHRSPMVIRSLEDYLNGHRFPLDTIYAHESVTHPACFETR